MNGTNKYKHHAIISLHFFTLTLTGYEHSPHQAPFATSRSVQGGEEDEHPKKQNLSTYNTFILPLPQVF